jgi:hypothetical protein
MSLMLCSGFRLARAALTAAEKKPAGVTPSAFPCGCRPVLRFRRYSEKKLASTWLMKS